MGIGAGRNQDVSRAGLGPVSGIAALSPFAIDYTFERIKRLEREVGRLKEEIRQGRDPGAVDAHNAGSAPLEQ